MRTETHREGEQARHREAARHHRGLAERLGRAGYHDLAAVHLLEARLAELNAAAAARSGPWCATNEDGRP